MSDAVRRTWVSAVWVTAALTGTVLRAQDQWDLANQNVPRLTPAAFRKLPPEVVTLLEDRHCTIPQSYTDSVPHSVIKGSFYKKGQTDWAALCSRARASTIVIVWGGKSECPDEMETREDQSYLRKVTGGEIKFARHIKTADRTFIVTMYDRFGGEAPPPIDHQGIDDIFEGKGSTIRYCYRGKWLELTGQQ
jgi:hypothetical protein